MGTADVSAAIRGILEEAIGVAGRSVPAQARDAARLGPGRAEQGARERFQRARGRQGLARAGAGARGAGTARARWLARCGRPTTAKVARIDAAIMRHIEKDVMLRTLDAHWRDHLAAMDYLRQGIHLRGYAQQDYRTEYKREAFQMFTAMLDRVKFETVTRLMQIEVRTQEEVDREEEERRRRLMRALQAQHAEAMSALAGGGEMPADAAASPRRPARGDDALAARMRTPAQATAAAGAAGAAGHLRPRRAQDRPQRALSLRLGQEVQALPRRALERRVRVLRTRGASRASDSGRRGGAARCPGKSPDRRAPGGQAHGRPLGVSRGQGRAG